MQNLRVTLVQADQIWENAEANFQKYESLVNGVETDLVVLPEMFQTCFSMNTSLAEPFETSSGISWLRRMAAKMDAAFYTSLMIEDNGKFFNRGIFMYPDGHFEHYDKRKTFGMANEDQHFDRGTKETIVAYKGWHFQLQICYDLRFPEIVRNRLSNQNAAYDVILYVANWPQKRNSHWKALLRARAIENQCYVIGVNRVGEDANGFSYSGDSVCVDALGSESTLEPENEMVRTIVMKNDDLKKIRELLPFLKDA